MKQSTSIHLVTAEGVSITIPVPIDKMSDAERAAYNKFTNAGNTDSLTETERQILHDRKILIGAGSPEALICRMDWSCWSIK